MMGIKSLVGPGAPVVDPETVVWFEVECDEVLGVVWVVQFLHRVVVTVVVGVVVFVVVVVGFAVVVVTVVVGFVVVVGVVVVVTVVVSLAFFVVVSLVFAAKEASRNLFRGAG